MNVWNQDSSVPMLDGPETRRRALLLRLDAQCDYVPKTADHSDQSNGLSS